MHAYMPEPEEAIGSDLQLAQMQKQTSTVPVIPDRAINISLTKQEINKTFDFQHIQNILNNMTTSSHNQILKCALGILFWAAKAQKIDSSACNFRIYFQLFQPFFCAFFSQFHLHFFLKKYQLKTSVSNSILYFSCPFLSNSRGLQSRYSISEHDS